MSNGFFVHGIIACFHKSAYKLHNKQLKSVTQTVFILSIRKIKLNLLDIKSQKLPSMNDKIKRQIDR